MLLFEQKQHLQIDDAQSSMQKDIVFYRIADWPPV